MCVCVHLVVRLLLLGLLAGLASAESGTTRIAGDALGSDSVKHACIDHDGRSTEAARSALRGFETAAEDTSQPACGAIRDMLGIPADVQRTIFNRGSLGGPRKTGSAFDGCRGGDRVEKMVSVELAGYGAAGLSAHHVPNASASLGSDACAEAAHKEACIMNVCTCATSEFGDTNVRCKEFSLEGDSAHAWDALLAGLLEAPLQTPRPNTSA